MRVFDLVGSAWTQVGADIDGEASSDFSGWSVALSSDGTRLAVGAYGNDGTGSYAGHVRVFDWSGSAWTQLGGDIDGEAADDRSGYSVALSSDGSRLAVGAYGNDGTGSNAGHVRVFDYGGVLKTKQIIKEDIVEIPGDLRAGCPVYFNVKKETDSDFGSDTTLVFPDVRSNQGSGYNSSDGIFTAPIAGTYFFIFTASTKNEGDNNIVKFRKNGGSRSNNRSDANNDYPDRDSMGLHDIINLDVDETVKVSFKGHLSSAPTYFSGFYLSS